MFRCCEINNIYMCVHMCVSEDFAGCSRLCDVFDIVTNEIHIYADSINPVKRLDQTLRTIVGLAR